MDITVFSFISLEIYIAGQQQVYSLRQKNVHEICQKFVKVDFHLVQNVALAIFSYCLRSSRMEPSRNLFNFNNTAVARAILCSK